MIPIYRRDLKINRHLYIFFIFLTSFLQAQNTRIGKTIYQETDLFSLFSNIDEDKALQLERMTALEFHNILNAYRTKFRKKTIFWDERLWLASRNHNVYQISIDVLWHNQPENTKYTTGFEPTDRVNYVTLNSRDFDFEVSENVAVSGELFSKIIDVEFANTLSWEELVLKAKEDALEMFNLWKSSNEHNRNMLDEEHIAHGTSIIYNHESSSVVGTSVFAQKQKYFDPSNLNLDFHSGWENYFQATYDDNYQTYIENPNKLSRAISKHMKSFSISMARKNMEFDKQLTNLLKNATKSENDSELRKRYLKQTYYFGLFRLSKHKLNQQFFNKVYTNEEFYSFKAVHDLKVHISNYSTFMDAKKWSGNLVIKEDSKGQFTVSLKTITFVPKK